jgi:hypothetical protein
VDLSFETLANENSGLSYVSEDPHLVILSEAADITKPFAEIKIPADVVEKLQQVDYQKHFVIIVLRGLVGGINRHYKIDILQVAQTPGKVEVFTHFGQPGPYEADLQATSSPYHMIAVNKDKGRWSRDIQISLYNDGKEVVQLDHFVP